MFELLKRLFGLARVRRDVTLKEAMAFLKEKRYKRAVEAFTSIAEREPGNIDAYRGRSQAYMMLGDSAKADEDYNKIQELAPPAPVMRDEVTAKVDEAKPDQSYGKTLPLVGASPSEAGNTVAPEKPAGMAFLQTAIYRTKDFESIENCDKAIRDITEAPEWVRQDNPTAFHNRGYAFFQKGQYEEAIRDFGEAIRLSQTESDAYFPCRMRGRAHLELRSWREAIADFTRVLAIEPSDVYAFGCRGAACSELGKHDDAIADCSEALRLNSSFWVAYVFRGFSYLQKGEYEHAIADYSEAIRLDPKCSDYYEKRAAAFRGIGDMSRALTDELKVQELQPDRPS
jgi:tetratricopeptide (TPR) repeat protein